LALFYEDLEIGHASTSPGRTITEADIMIFAGLTGDLVELHTNEEVARRSRFGRRIAHGALVFSTSVGLATRMHLLDDCLLAFAGVDHLRFVEPVGIGDTIHITKRVIERREVGADSGVVTFETRVLNQHDTLVVIYHDKLLVKRRPAAASAREEGRVKE
jgi:acyl dehydratase